MIGGMGKAILFADSKVIPNRDKDQPWPIDRTRFIGLALPCGPGLR
jgi:hypothetical protein